jgi:two-component system cell cycle response regulator
MRVLIADDSATSRALLRATLQRWGYEVLLAEDGQQAWEILSSDNPPPVAILDWVMPGFTGIEVCRKVRDTRREPYTYILLLTSKNTKEETVEGMDSGADDYIVKPFHEHELQVRLRAGQRIVALQMDLVNAREQLRERAEKDLLTMLPNRSAIQTMLDQEIARCHRRELREQGEHQRREGSERHEHSSVGVILLDLDHFKAINDTYGHFAGDAVLRETAHRFRANMRPYDHIGRYGGEEFLVVLPDSDLDQTAHQAERMRLILAERPMYVDGKELKVTASFGVTASDEFERSSDCYVRVADAALYLAKNGGRNRVSKLRISEAAANGTQISAYPHQHDPAAFVEPASRR